MLLTGAAEVVKKKLIAVSTWFKDVESYVVSLPKTGPTMIIYRFYSLNSELIKYFTVIVSAEST